MDSQTAQELAKFTEEQLSARARYMTKAKRYRSPALESLHEVIQDLHEVGAIDEATMRDFDVGCLTEVKDLAPEAIRQIREKARMARRLSLWR
jgi:hypothetical protein